MGNPPVLNKANAGQTIPLPWQITNAGGVGISDPKSFVSVTSDQVNCANLSAISVEVDATSPGASGLQYLGNGNWQFNWKTSKSYAGSCRTIHLNLNDGTSHLANFTFK